MSNWTNHLPLVQLSGSSVIRWDAQKSAITAYGTFVEIYGVNVEATNLGSKESKLSLGRANRIIGSDSIYTKTTKRINLDNELDRSLPMILISIPIFTNIISKRVSFTMSCRFLAISLRAIGIVIWTVQNKKNGRNMSKYDSRLWSLAMSTNIKWNRTKVWATGIQVNHFYKV